MMAGATGPQVAPEPAPIVQRLEAELELDSPEPTASGTTPPGPRHSTPSTTLAKQTPSSTCSKNTTATTSAV